MSSDPQGKYSLDAERIKLNAYRLLCLFYANKEISQTSDPVDPTNSAALLERHFFAREMTDLLLSISIGIRVLDDQMLSLSPNSSFRKLYLARRDAVNSVHSCMMFDIT